MKEKLFLIFVSIMLFGCGAQKYIKGNIVEMSCYSEVEGIILQKPLPDKITSDTTWQVFKKFQLDTLVHDAMLNYKTADGVRIVRMCRISTDSVVLLGCTWMREDSTCKYYITLGNPKKGKYKTYHIDGGGNSIDDNDAKISNLLRIFENDSTTQKK